ncbi:MAG: cytochrome c biogenesis protein CcdA [Candidatus Omnitrophica bacterium]|nr:cytochrome c biogenesis protein CcdA [Candidatus Omnitrophota bacterium]
MINVAQMMISKSPILAIFVVFGVGFVASLSSCTLVRIPIVFGYISGASHSKKHSLLLSLCLVAGLVFSYTLVGMLLLFLKNFTSNLVQISRYMYLALGFFLLVAGLFYAGLIPAVHAQAHCSNRTNTFKRSGFIGAFIFGAMFAFLEMPACPCCASVLFVIIGAVSLINSWIYSFIVLLSFALGQSLPIFLIGFSTNLTRILAPKVAQIEKYIQFAAGTILIVIALYFLIIA